MPEQLERDNWPYIERFIKQLDDARVDRRAEAADNLGRYRDSLIVEPLINHFNDSNVGVREKVAQSLGHQKDARAIEPLVDALQDPDPIVHYFAVFALCLIEDERVIEPVLAAMRNGAYISGRAANTLARTGGSALVDKWISWLDDPIPLARARAARALGDVDDKRVVPALIAALHDSDGDVRSSAVEALGEASLQKGYQDDTMNGTYIYGSAPDPAAIEGVIKLLSDPVDNVRYKAVRALGRMGGDRTMEVLQEVMHSINPQLEPQANTPLMLLNVEVATKLGDAWAKLGESLAAARALGNQMDGIAERAIEERNNS